MGGVNLRTVQTLLGHEDLGITMRDAVSALDKGLKKSVHTQEVQISDSGSSQL
jgi:site-specific recombinase XerD